MYEFAAYEVLRSGLGDALVTGEAGDRGTLWF